MKFKTGGELLAGLLVTLGLLQPLQAQRESSNPDQKEKTENSAIRIGLGSTSGTPGTIVVVPIYLTLPESVKVGKLKLEVNYVSANMKFVKVDSGITTKSANVDLASDVSDGKNDKGVDTQTLTLTASVSNQEPSSDGIPGGILGYLTLRISETGRPATITMRTRAEASRLGAATPDSGVQTADAIVEVLAEGSQPAVACFFFTH